MQFKDKNRAEKAGALWGGGREGIDLTGAQSVSDTKYLVNVFISSKAKRQ